MPLPCLARLPVVVTGTPSTKAPIEALPTELWTNIVALAAARRLREGADAQARARAKSYTGTSTPPALATSVARAAFVSSGLQLALRPTVDTEVKRSEAERDAMEGILAMTEQPDPKRRAMPQSDEPPTAGESMNAMVPAAPVGPVLWETKFGTGPELFARLRSLPPETQHKILALLQPAESANVGDGDGGRAKMKFEEFQGYNPDSKPSSKQAGNTGKQMIWFEGGFNPGGSLYARNESQGGASQVFIKNKAYFRVQVTGPIAKNDLVIVTLHAVVGQSSEQVTEAWAKAQLEKGDKKDAVASGPFLDPNRRLCQFRKGSGPPTVDQGSGPTTVDQLEFPLDTEGYSVNTNNDIPDLTILYINRMKKGGAAHMKFFLKIALKSNPNVYQTTPAFNIFARMNDEGRKATANVDLPQGYRVVQESETAPSLLAARCGLPSAPDPSSGAGSSTDPLVATVVPPSGAEPDPQ